MHASQYRHIGLSVKTHIGATLLLATPYRFFVSVICIDLICTIIVLYHLVTYFLASSLTTHCNNNMDTYSYLGCGCKLFIVTPRAHARQGVKWSSLSFCLFFLKKILRWRELATFRTSEHIIRFENAPILLTCTCHWADSFPLSGISAVFLLSGPLCQPFYLRPPVTPTNYMPCVRRSFTLHSIFMPTPSLMLRWGLGTRLAHAQQLTLHSGCGIVQSAQDMCSVEL